MQDEYNDDTVVLYLETEEEALLEQEQDRLEWDLEQQLIAYQQLCEAQAVDEHPEFM